jgi:methyl-accepting chemotaxis protein
MEKQEQHVLEPNRIGVQLAIAFGLLVSILVGVGWLGLARMGSMNEDLEAIVGKRWAKVDVSRRALNYSAANNRITMEVFILDDQKEIEQLLRHRAENTEEISAAVNELEQRGAESGKEKELLNAVKAARAPYIASYKQALDLLLKEHKPEQARAVMVGLTLPRLIAYHDAWSAFVDFQGKQMDEVAQQSRINYQDARRMVLGLLALAAVISVGIGVFVTRGMTREIVSRERALEAIEAANCVKN